MDDLNKENTFSVIIPTWNRASILPKAINSVLDQTYQNFELIIIDDGSTDKTQEALKKYSTNPKVVIIKNEKPQERVISWNKGMRAAKNEWICFLDSDDEWIFGYLEIMNYNINKFPKYKMFHFGHIVVSLTGTTIKRPFEEMEESPDGVGMKHFDAGKLGTGSFIFKKECLEESGYLPDVNNVFDLADLFGEKVKEYWKERKLTSEPPKYNRDDKWCGNPWGNDFVLAWMLTRKFKSKCLYVYPLIAYIRTEPWLYERAIVSGTMSS